MILVGGIVLCGNYSYYILSYELIGILPSSQERSSWLSRADKSKSFKDS